MKKALKIVVLAKQVPDTRNVGKDAMTPEGTVNRAALPAIFNPEDLNALEMALALKDETEGSTVHILTMGPPRAADIIRDAMFRGADGGYLLTDRKFAGADTLATSYALSCALRKIRPDVIVATGRTDYPNQVNNVLGFPYIFRGALDVRARKINEAMKLAAAHALAELAREEVPAELTAAFGVDRLEFGPDYLIPKLTDPRLLGRVAPAVARAAVESGVAQRRPDIE